MNWIPISLVIALAVQFSCQIFKLFYYSIRAGRLDLKFLVTPGGMPSAHSAFVTAITASVAVRNGLNSEVFAVSFVFSAIVIFDALRLRGEVQAHAQALNRLSKRVFPEQEGEPLSEMVGHTAPEIAAGILLGLGVGIPLALGSLTLGL